MSEHRTTIRIYVSSLSDYNNGILHGAWIDADLPDHAFHDAVKRMLARSPWTARTGEPAEEWLVVDEIIDVSTHEGSGH